MGRGYRRPSTPSCVERLLRQESGFGCARCGHPYVEYHHIIPYSEDPHFRPEDMVALCGNCHPMVAKWQMDRQYETKAHPINIKNGNFLGALEFDKRELVFKVGGNWYKNTSVILQFFDRPVISCSISEGQALVSIDLFDQRGRSLLKVVNNNITFRVGDIWDFQYAHNMAIVRYGAREIALRMDFRQADAVIEGKLWFGKTRVSLGKDETTLPDKNAIKNCSVENCAVGIQIGNPTFSPWQFLTRRGLGIRAGNERSWPRWL